MPTVIQRSFSGGELAPSLYARVDVSKYQNGLRTLRNFYTMRHGGAANRPGTLFVGEVKDSTKAVRLIPFVFNNAQTYILEFGNLYMRVVQDGAHLTDTAEAIEGVTQADPAVVTITGHSLSTGDEIYISGAVGMTEINNRNFKVTSLGANSFSLQHMDGADVDSSGFGYWSSGGITYRIYTLNTTYLEADLPTLQFVQSADVITIAHPTYPPRELSRTGHTSWSIANISFAPGIAAPTGTPTATGGSSTETFYTWKITAVAEETYEESLASVSTASTQNDFTANDITLAWTAVSGAVEYNIYREESANGIYGFVGVAASNGYVDTGIDADFTDTPPTTRDPFSGSDNYPSTVTYIQQRLTFANTNNDPEKVWTSRTGNFHNYTRSSPLQDDDAVTFTMAGRQVNSVRHLMDLGTLVILTNAGEWSASGDESGIIKPTAVNLKQHTYNGSSTLPPILINGNALYLQARGSIIRDLGFNFEVDGYRGNDLTIFSAHLFDGYEMADWSFQQVPHSILWVARDDGTLLGCTYVKEHQLLAWHRHDFTNGLVENVCVIPENNEDSLYLVIQRTIDGVSKRYIERMSTRRITDIVDSTFLDSYLSYDGRNSGSRTMTLSGGPGWDFTDNLTLTASTGFFTASEVGNQIHLTGADGEIIRFTINGYTSSTVVTGKPHKTVPASLQSTATLVWTRAVDQLGGLWHLEGQSVSVFADGFVVANPNNVAYDAVAVADGTITLDKAYGVIHVGLPITSDLETLDIDQPDGETITDKEKLISEVTLFTESSRGVFIGPEPPTDDEVDPVEGLTELKLRDDEDYDNPVELKTGTADIIIQQQWNSNGRIFVRQIDPIPLTLLAVAPKGMIG